MKVLESTDTKAFILMNKKDEVLIHFEGHTFSVSYDEKTNESLRLDKVE